MDTRDDARRQFWRLLSDYEELTRGETAAVRQRDYPSLAEAQEHKAAILPVLQQTAAWLGLDRTNCPELVARLDKVSAAEGANLETLAERRQGLQREAGELSASRQRLRTVKRNYGSDQPAGVSPGSFAACG